MEFHARSQDVQSAQERLHAKKKGNEKAAINVKLSVVHGRKKMTKLAQSTCQLICVVIEEAEDQPLDLWGSWHHEH